MLRHAWHVDAIEDDNSKSSILYKYDRDEIFKIIVLAGGHRTVQTPKRHFQTSTDCSGFFFIPLHWTCHPIIVSYSEQDKTKHFPSDLPTFDLTSQLLDLLSHLHGSEYITRSLSKLSFDMKLLMRTINVANMAKVNEDQQANRTWERTSSLNLNLMDDKFSDFNFVPRQDGTLSLYNDIVSGISVSLDQLSISGHDHQESISIGGNSV